MKGIDPFQARTDWTFARFLAANYVIACVTIILSRVIP